VRSCDDEPVTGPSGRPPRWATVGLPLALAALVAVAVAVVLVLDGGRDPGPRPSTSVAAGTEVPSSELEGEWSGEGALTRCAGYEDDGCPRTLSITLSIDCSGDPCTVTPFESTYGTPPLRFEDGRYRAAGPVPPELAPTCGGVPTRSALWRLELTVVGGRLGGTYEESTLQGFDCGATGVEWDVALDRI
jgi:hypothetical protein